ncbi:glucose-1-phosphate cytidylyltransferase [Nitrospira sp. M1]
MKVVLFCGGLGMRLREYSETIPKPMVTIGYRPILWHVMKYYAHYGHKDFILCLGYRADVIKEYFLQYNECLSNNFTIKNGGKSLELLNTDTQDWNITFVDTGLKSNIGQRLKAVESYLGEDEVFLANYSDSLTDCPLPDILDHFSKIKKTASFLCVRPPHSFHVVQMKHDGQVTDVRHVGDSGLWINGGFFVLRKEIFQYMHDGEELVCEPFARLVEQDQLSAYQYRGFWATMDTFKEKQHLDELDASGEAPWELWRFSGPKQDNRDVNTEIAKSHEQPS